MKNTQIYISGALLLLLLFIAVLSSCKLEPKDVYDHSSETTSDVTYNTSDLFNTEETVAETASMEYVRQFVNNVELPQIIINENSTPYEIMQAGKTAGMYFGKITEKYFGYGVSYEWKTDYSNNFEGWSKCLGPYIDDEKTKYVPMNGEESKQFLIDYLGITENGYEDLCKNSPSTYMIRDNSLYVASGDGGQAGWSYSYIIDYEMSENTVIYNCARVGRKERWNYDEDLIEPFTFQLAYEDGKWKLDGVSYGEGFFYWIIGLESDIDPYLNNDEDWQENVVNRLK